MANPKKKHSYKKSRKRNTKTASHRAPARHAFRKSTRRKKTNPARRGNAISRPATKHHYRKKRNPSLGGAMQLLWKIGFGLGGAIGSRSIPQLPMVNKFNTGFIGYLLNGASAFALATLAGKFKGQQAFEYTLFGGLMMTFARAFDDFTGIKLASFISVNPGATPFLSGDAKTGALLAGAFSSNAFVLPTSTPLAARRMLPAGQPASAPAAVTAAKLQGAYLSDSSYLD